MVYSSYKGKEFLGYMYILSVQVVSILQNLQSDWFWNWAEFFSDHSHGHIK